VTEQLRASAWIIEEYAEGEPIDEKSCRPVLDPADPDEPRFQGNDIRRPPAGRDG
jgi:hypothetical protein